MIQGEGEKIVIFGTSTASDGSMGPVPDASHNIMRFVGGLCRVDPENTVQARLVHGNAVAFVNAEDRGKGVPQCDGLVTTTPDLPLFIRTQDCVPVFLRDDGLTFVGILHAGWRNILSGIVPHGIHEIEKNLGIPPKRILMTLGPHIKQCCYEVGEEILDRLNIEYWGCVSTVGGKHFLDLGKIIWIQARISGIFTSNIEQDPDCTYHTFDTTQFKYFSWRRDKKKNRNLGSAIVLQQKA